MDLMSKLQALIKLVVVLAYAGFGVFLLSLAAGRRIRFFKVPRSLVTILAGSLTGLVWLWYILHGYLFIVSVVIGIAIFVSKDGAWRSRQLVFAGVAVVVLSASLAWWLGEGPQPTGWVRPAVFAIVVWCLQTGFLHVGEPSRRSWRIPLLVLFALSGFALMANMTQYPPGSTALALLVHHQGAYVGPALHIRAGLVPFYDIPLQYGIGPTLSIAAACGASHCWSSMEFLMIASTLMMGLLILSMALTTRVARGNVWRATATFVIFTALFLWPGLSFLGNIVTAFPSIGGLRFLPVTLLAFLLFFRRTTLAAIVLAPAVLWSPETGVMALVVYGVHETARIGFVKAATRTVAMSGASFLTMVIVHHMVYGIWLQPDVFAEYILHVPTPYPINPIGDFLFLAAALGLAAWNVYRPAMDQIAFRQDLVVSSLLFATVSYYLGRSHPNNVCNLMPFIALVLLRTLDGKSPVTMPNFTRLAILGTSVATGAVMLSHWNYLPFSQGFSMDAGRVATAAARLDTDMIDVRSRISNPENLPIANLGHLNRDPLETMVWTPIDPCSLWTSVPHDRRQLYIRRSAARLRLSGWIILHDDQLDWLNDFRVAYRITEEKIYKIQSSNSHQQETYVVARLTPLEVVSRLLSAGIR
jgi:hypothetical protein